MAARRASDAAPITSGRSREFRLPTLEGGGGGGVVGDVGVVDMSECNSIWPAIWRTTLLPADAGRPLSVEQLSIDCSMGKIQNKLRA